MPKQIKSSGKQVANIRVFSVFTTSLEWYVISKEIAFGKLAMAPSETYITVWVQKNSCLNASAFPDCVRHSFHNCKKKTPEPFPSTENKLIFLIFSLMLDNRELQRRVAELSAICWKSLLFQFQSLTRSQSRIWNKEEPSMSRVIYGTINFMKSFQQLCC